MHVFPLYLVAAIVVLIFPVGVLHGARTRHRLVVRKWQDHWRRVLSFPLHWLDVIRAAAGAGLLAYATAQMPITALGRYSPQLLHLAVFAVALALQTLVCRERGSARAPLAFVLGLLLGYLPPMVSVASLLLTLTLAVGLRTPASFFLAAALTPVVFGFVFLGKKILPTTLVLLCALPLPYLFSLLFQRPLVVEYAARRSTTPRSPLRDERPVQRTSSKVES